MRFAVLTLLIGSALTPAAWSQASDIGNQQIATGFQNVTDIVAAPGQPDWLYIVEQRREKISILDLNTNTVISEFLNVSSLVNSGASERGLLGLAFHPNYQANGFFYINYTNNAGNTVVRRYTTDLGVDPTVAVATSGTPIIVITQPQSNHNGGALRFGPDGMLWIATGDGGNANDSGSGHASGGNSQSGATLLGKMLRLDVDSASPYAIPSDNPFLSDSMVLDEIWAFGLRNPWRFNFDEPTGDLYIADVGQGAREEVNVVEAATIADVAAGTMPGLNFGWRCKEGFNNTGLSGCNPADPTLIDPVKQYTHGVGISITGGYVYRGEAIPDLKGTYFYADYGTNRLFSFRYDGAGAISEDLEQTSNVGFVARIATFGLGNDGELYWSRHNNDEIFKLVPNGDFFGLGSAHVGVAGEPVHWGTGSLADDEPGALHLRDAAPSSAAGIFIGLTEGSVAFKGGTLVAFPFLKLTFANTDSNGEFTIPWTDLGPLPSGTTVVTQWAVSDAAALGGVSLSNGVRSTVP